MTPQLNCLGKTVQVRGHNIQLQGEIRKIIPQLSSNTHSYQELCVIVLQVSPVGRISPVMMYPCPLCNQKFSHDIIQIHASECVGDIEEEG